MLRLQVRPHCCHQCSYLRLDPNAVTNAPTSGQTPRLSPMLLLQVRPTAVTNPPASGQTPSLSPMLLLQVRPHSYHQCSYCRSDPTVVTNAPTSGQTTTLSPMLLLQVRPHHCHQCSYCRSDRSAVINAPSAGEITPVCALTIFFSSEGVVAGMSQTSWRECRMRCINCASYFVMFSTGWYSISTLF